MSETKYDDKEIQIRAAKKEDMKAVAEMIQVHDECVLFYWLN